MSFVAVLCLNDYPHSVSQSCETHEAAQQAGHSMREEARAQHASSLAQMASSHHFAFYHFHVLEQKASTDRRKADRRQSAGRRSASIKMVLPPEGERRKEGFFSCDPDTTHTRRLTQRRKP